MESKALATSHTARKNGGAPGVPSRAWCTPQAWCTILAWCNRTSSPLPPALHSQRNHPSHSPYAPPGLHSHPLRPSFSPHVPLGLHRKDPVLRMDVIHPKDRSPHRPLPASGLGQPQPPACRSPVYQVTGGYLVTAVYPKPVLYQGTGVYQRSRGELDVPAVYR